MKLAAALLLFAGTAGALWFGPKTKSVWRDREIRVDGRENDWAGRERDDEQGLAYAFSNDALDLFVLAAPRSRLYREELTGAYEQDFTLWLDPGAGMKKRVGLRWDAERRFQLVYEGDREPPGCETADLALGDFDVHGVLEARVPLACFGGSPTKTFTVGFEAGEPKRPPSKKPGERFDRLYLWVRVTPAAPAK